MEHRMNSFRLLCLRLLLPLLFLSFGSRSTWAWGCKGHQTVALIAERQLTPQVRQFVEKLLAENPIDPQLIRYCGHSTRDLLAEASTWPDDIRNDLKNGPWHYIDIPAAHPVHLWRNSAEVMAALLKRSPIRSLS
jgi:S1/P1 Nuclease